MSQSESLKPFDVDDLAQEIRRVDGSNSLGAGALAEALVPFIVAAWNRRPSTADRGGEASERLAKLERALTEINREATVANDVIRLNRDGDGQGRIRVATAMHRIAALAAALVPDKG